MAKAKQPTGKERQDALALADRVARAKAASPPRDPTGEHHEALADIARRAGLDVVDLLDRWDEIAAIKQYMGCVDQTQAEREATADLVEFYAPRQVAMTDIGGDPARGR